MRNTSKCLLVNRVKRNGFCYSDILFFLAFRAAISVPTQMTDFRMIGHG